jgi:hypothetical protein
LTDWLGERRDLLRAVTEMQSAVSTLVLRF